MRQRAASAGSWLASHPVDVVFALLVTAAFAYTLHITRWSYFWADDWLLIRQAGSVRGLFRPYNGHLSIIILGTYRVLLGGFGFAHTPIRVVSLMGLLAVPSGYFLTTRRQFGATLAALLALPLLWYGRHVSLNPSEFNHYLALVGGIGCAAALNRGRRADWVLAAALTFSLCSAGGGVAVAGACVVHNLCTRAPVRRWLAVLVPTLLWLAWWLIAVGHPTDLGPLSLTTSQTVRFVRDLSYSAFDGAALGVPVLAVALLFVFVVSGVWALSRGLDAGANFLAWSFGLLAWGVGVARSRGALASTDTFRYRYVALGLVLLAVVPRRPIVWPARFPINTDRRFAVASALVVLALGSARGLAVHGDMQSSADQLGAIGRLTRGKSLVMEFGPSVVSDDAVLPFAFGGLRAGEVRALFADYGEPFPSTRAGADQRLVDIGVVGSQAFRSREVIGCKRLIVPFKYRPTSERPFQLLRSPGNPFVVDVRRFGNRWVRLDEARAGDVLRLVLPSLDAAAPWEIRANDSCRVGAQKR